MEGAIVVLAIVAVAVIAVVVALRRRAGTQPESGNRDGVAPSAADEPPALHGDVRRLGPGDVVAYDGTDFVVDRTMRFDEEGASWDEHLLLDEVSGRRMRLSVEDDDGLEVAVYRRMEGAVLEPGPAEITHEGTAFRRDGQGRAAYRTEERSGQGARGAMEYADYVADARRLSFERYGTGGWEVSTGVQVSEHALDVRPAR